MTSIASMRRASPVRFTTRLGTAILAAAVIPLVILLFVNNPLSASGPSARDIDRELARAKNVHVAQFGADLKTPTQEYWASRAQGILIWKTADASVVYDLKKRHQWTRKRGQVSLDRDAYERARRSMEGLLGPSVASSQWDAELTEIEEPAQAAVGDRVYELIYDDPRSGEPRKWRVRVDSKDNRLRKAEFFRWNRLEEQFFLATTRDFHYPPEDDILRCRDALLSGN